MTYAAVAAALLLLAERAALACPACAGRSEGGVTTGVLIGAMVAVPYAVAAVGFRVVRRLGRDEVQSGQPDGAGR